MSRSKREKYLKNSILEKMLGIITDQANFERMNEAITTAWLEKQASEINYSALGINEVIKVNFL